MRFRTSTITITVIILASLIAGSVHAATSFAFGTSHKRIAAAVLNYTSANQMAFYVMNQRQDLKPAGWDFYNPLAQTGTTPDQANYWLIPDISKLSYEDISKLNIILLAAAASPNFGSNAMKLRRFVDGGGTLWIDGSGSVSDASFVGGLGFDSATLVSPVSILSTTAAHPLLNRPLEITEEDLANLTPTSGTFAINHTDSSATEYFYPLVMDGANNWIVAAGEYGSGYIVATSIGVANSLNTTGDIFYLPEEPLKLAYNIVNWGSEHSTYHKDPRHSGSSFQEIGGALSEMWTYKVNSSNSFITPESSPAILDDMVFFVDSNKVLHAIDLSPTRDRKGDVDGDTSPDDGILDQSLGAPYDEVWNTAWDPTTNAPRTNLLGSYPSVSSPTVAYVPLPGQGLVAVVFVATGNGTVEMFRASDGLPIVYSGSTDDTSQNAIPFGVGVPAPPTYSDGELYWGDGKGRLHGINFFTGGNPLAWYVETSFNTPALASPSVGWMHDPTRGVMDQVVYLPDSKDEGGNVAGNIRPFVIKVVGDVLDSSFAKTDRDVQYYCREANGSKLVDTAARLKVYFSLVGGAHIPLTYGTSGDAYYQMSTIQGNVLVHVAQTFLDANPACKGAALQADYEIDPTPVSSGNASALMSKPSIEARRPTATNDVSIDASPSMGPKDILYFKTSNGSDTLYATQMTGSGRVVVKWRWTLAGTQFSSYHFIGSPVASGDLVYAVVTNGSDGFVMAFEADPAITLNVGQPIGAGMVNVVQLDPLDNAAGDTTIASNTPYGTIDPTKPQFANFFVDYSHGKLVFYNLRPNSNLSQDLDCSADVRVVFGATNASYNWRGDWADHTSYAVNDGVTYSGASYGCTSAVTGAIDPDKNLTPDQDSGHWTAVTTNSTEQRHQAFAPSPGDHWNNLVWYMPISDGPSSAPTVLGNYLYVGCGSGTLGSLWAVNLAATRQRYPGPISQAIASDDLVAHSILSASPITSSVAGANGMLAVTTKEGLMVLGNPVTLVADANRIVEVDASGQIAWMSEATVDTVTSTTGPSGTPVYHTVTTPFNRPAVARYSSTGGILVADTGNNRVVQMTKGGRVLHEIRSFSDPGSVLSQGSPLTLDRPTDVSTWMTNETTGTAYHYLVADSGHFRLLEIVWALDSTTGTYQDKLTWASQSFDKQGKEYAFATARSVYCADLQHSGDASLNKWMTSSVISNAIPSMYAQTPSSGTQGSSSIVFVNGPPPFATDPNDTTSQYLGQVPAYPGLDGSGNPIFPNTFLATLNSGQVDPQITNPSYYIGLFTSGTPPTFAPLHVSSFNLKGAWSDSASYRIAGGVADVVSYNGNDYYCIANVTGTGNLLLDNPAEDVLHWRLVFRAKDPTFFDRLYVSGSATESQYYDLIVDASGVHVDLVQLNSTGPVYRTDTWRHYTQAQYQFDRNDTTRKFHPGYGQILPNGNVLLVNKLSVQDSPGVDSPGEIVELKLDLLDASTNTYRYVSVAPTAFAPIGSTKVTQPASVERQVH